MSLHLALLGQTCVDNRAHLDAQLKPGWTISHWLPSDGPEALNKQLAQADAVITGGDALMTGHVFKAIPKAAQLRLLQIPFAGYDWLRADFLNEGTVACNAFGHEGPIAEYIIAGLLEWEIGFRKLDADFRAGSWRYTGSSRDPESLHGEVAGKTLGLFGYGSIGRETAHRAKAFGMKTIALARSARSEPPAPLDWIGTRDDMDRFLGECDYLALVCDLNDETRHAIDADALSKMKSTAVIVNVARGPVAEEEALYNALKTRQIAGAVLDTWYTYPGRPQPGQQAQASPRPSRFAYHELDNLIMTPHCSAHTAGADIKRWHDIADNLNRLARGQDLKNVIMTGTTKRPAA